MYVATPEPTSGFCIIHSTNITAQLINLFAYISGQYWPMTEISVLLYMLLISRYDVFFGFKQHGEEKDAVFKSSIF